MAAHFAIVEVMRVEPVGDGAGLRLVLRDAQGQTLVLAMPPLCVGALLSDLPAQHRPAAGAIEDVQSWRLDTANAAGPDLTLTLQTPEGRIAAFHLTPGQIAGMATLPLHNGAAGPTPTRTLN